MKTVTVEVGQTVDLGYQYDNLATQVVFPASIITPFHTEFGTGGTFAIWYRRSGDANGYIVDPQYVNYDGSTVTWSVVEDDVANPGVAQVQLRYVIDDHYVMSQIFGAIVNDSVDIGT